jgi:hypothetical protein
MPISARNKLRGTIAEIILGNVMAHVGTRMQECPQKLRAAKKRQWSLIPSRFV